MSLLGREGNFSGRAFVNYVQKVTTQPVGAPETDVVGMLWKLRGGIPHWKWLVTTQYTTGPWSVSAVGHYVGGGKFDNTLPDFPGNDTFDGQFWLDLTVRREFVSLELYGAVNNVFNTDPTIIPGFGQTDEPTNTGLYDTHGRRFVVGLRFSL